MPEPPFHPDRLEKLEELIALGVDPYPARSPADRAAAADLVAAVDDRTGQTATVHGRVMGRRGYGKLAFLDLADRSGRIQACLQKDRLPAAEFALLKRLHLGDIVSVTGELGRTRTGEPTLFADRFRLLAKALAQPPEKWHGLADAELRARRRYVDLFSNDEVRERFLRRSRLIQAMREVFLARGYTEVETPVLHPIYGGANARPFVTHHNALDLDLYLRIAPELYLKRLLVGGIERVFEFARVFRNEGLSPRHNPEFTMLEFYEAYSDYAGMMDLTEELVVAAARAAGLEREDGSIQATFRGREYSLRPPFRRLHYAEAFAERVGCSPLDRVRVQERLREHEIEVTGDGELAWWRAVNDLFEAVVEPELSGPVFVLDYPAAICPLAKPKADDPTWAERFEFFLGGMELANAFSELNDPRLQLARFEEQVADKDPEGPNRVDHDYIRALAHGMPPAGGCGIGVDRLAMVLLGCDSIREVLLFPHLRPERGGTGDAAAPPA
ncbi:MAG: lysine--tRNA ligase [Planctomycetota bacterium]|nr:MAG: lysine--tRNA ligase [Planctomycetota bacterium]